MQHGNMTHYPSGRKKKYNAWSTKKKEAVEFQPLTTSSQPYRRETKQYQSVSNTICSTEYEVLSSEERIKISSGYTIAPAYNKGAYQVISRDQIENIGR